MVGWFERVQSEDCKQIWNLVTRFLHFGKTLSFRRESVLPFLSGSFNCQEEKNNFDPFDRFQRNVVMMLSRNFFLSIFFGV